MKTPALLRGGLVALLASALILVPATTATAEQNVPITVNASAIGPDGETIADGALHYDAARGDTAESGYQIGYRGELEMRNIWIRYIGFRALWMASDPTGNTEANWRAKTFSGDWETSFTIDPTVVSVNEDLLTPEVFQSAYEDQNTGTGFTSFVRVSDVDYDETSGTITTSFTLGFEDGSRVTGATLDNRTNRPRFVTFTTPPEALFVQQSNFSAGTTFDMVNPRVSGEISMDYFYNQTLMPLVFDGTGDPITLTMVAN